MREISVGFPSMKVKLTLWAGTEDEEKFVVRAVKSENPYVVAYGIKHYLTKEEACYAKSLLKALT